MTANDTAFQFAAANIRFGAGITREVGDDLVDLGARRTMVLIDPALRDSSTGETVISSLKAARRNATRMGLRAAQFIAMKAADTAQFLSRAHYRPEVVIMDPPRTGASALMEPVARLRARSVLYV